MPPSRRHRHVQRRVGVRPVQRAAAVAALVANLIGLVALVVLVVHRPGYSLLLLALAAAFVAAVFFALTSTGARRTLGSVAAAASGVGLVVGVLMWGREGGLAGWLGPVAVLSVAVGALLERFALTVPPRIGTDLFVVAPGERRTRHPVLIVNLKSGGGKAERFDLPGRCHELGIEAVILEPGARLEELAEDAVARGADALGMAGGDGSLAFVARVAVEHDLPFVCIPSGTRNHFALDIGLDREDPRHALSAFLNGEERRIDYATVNGRMFLNNVSLGVYAAIVEQESYRDAKLETTLGLLPQLWAEGGPWFDLSFDVPDHGHLEKALLVQVSSGPYDSTEFGRRTRLDTGELGVVTANPERVADLVNVALLAAVRKQDRASALWTWASPSLRIESGQPEVAAGLDGETVALQTPLEFESVHRALRLLVPPGSRLGVAEQNLGAGSRTKGLLEVAFGLAPAPGGDA